jgi:hypothetical protein
MCPFISWFPRRRFEKLGVPLSKTKFDVDDTMIRVLAADAIYSK